MNRLEIIRAARLEAIRVGEKKFYPDAPCQYGHVGAWRTKANCCVACIAGWNAAWHAKNKPRNNAKRRENYVARHEKERAKQVEWKGANREKVNCYERNRRALKKASAGTHTAADIIAIRKMQRDLCAYCRGSVKGRRGHVDHIFPLALGGGNGRENLQILCKPCNSSKLDRHPIEFAQRIGRLL